MYIHVHRYHAVYTFLVPKIEYLELKQEAIAAMDSIPGGYLASSWLTNAGGMKGLWYSRHE